MTTDVVKEIKKDLHLMLRKTREMLELVEEAFIRNKITPLEEAGSLAQEINRKEDELTERLAAAASSDAAARSLVSVPAHIEKVATSIRRIEESVRSRIKDGLLFSDKALHETEVLFGKAKDTLKKAGDAVITASQASADEIISECDAIERIATEYTTAHENRIITGEASPRSSTVYLCILYAFDDMAGHLKSAVQRTRS